MRKVGGKGVHVAVVLLHDAVDDAQAQQVVGGEAQRLRRLGRLGAVLVEDRGAALGR